MEGIKPLQTLPQSILGGGAAARASAARLKVNQKSTLCKWGRLKTPDAMVLTNGEQAGRTTMGGFFWRNRLLPPQTSKWRQASRFGVKKNIASGQPAQQREPGGRSSFNYKSAQDPAHHASWSAPWDETFPPVVRPEAGNAGGGFIMPSDIVLSCVYGVGGQSRSVWVWPCPQMTHALVSSLFLFLFYYVYFLYSHSIYNLFIRWVYYLLLQRQNIKYICIFLLFICIYRCISIYIHLSI